MQKPTTLTTRSRHGFIGRLHRKLGWGWEIWTEDGYDVITPCNRFYEVFNLTPEMPIMLHRNHLWMPASALKMDSENVIRERFRVNGETAIRVALDPPYESFSQYSSISAVYAHTWNELNLRTQHALRQRKAWKRWYKDQTVRVKIHLSELTTVRIDMLVDVIARLNQQTVNHHPLLPYNTVDDTGYWLRLAFAQLSDNPILQYQWNTQTLAGLTYRMLDNGWATLSTEHFSILNVGRETPEAAQCSAYIDKVGLPYTPDKPILDCLTTGYIDDLNGLWYPK